VRFSSSHTRLVDGDLDQPGAEPRFRAKLPDVLECFQHRFLGDILGVGFVAQNRKGGGVHAPLVGTDQLVEQIVLAVADAPDQHGFVLD
jgi:hypothetical protein